MDNFSHKINVLIVVIDMPKLIYIKAFSRQLFHPCLLLKYVINASFVFLHLQCELPIFIDDKNMAKMHEMIA